MKLIKLTTDNANQYVGYEILFKTRGSHIIKRILDVSNSSIKIDHPDLQNNLQILTRNVYVIIEKDYNKKLIE